MTLTYILLACAAVMGVSLTGKLFSWRVLGGFLERNLSYLVSFAAGVLLIVVYGLIEEVLAEASSPAYAISWIAVGSFAVLIAFRLIPDFHHHHHEQEPQTHSHSQVGAKRILASDALHNLGDGILLAGSFVVSPAVGIFATISIFLHEMLQEVSEFFVLRQSGLSINRAIAYNFAVSCFVLVGAVGGYFLLEQFEMIEVPILALSAGAYLVVVFFDLIPHSLRSSTQNIQYARHALWFVAGLAIMYSVTFAFGHGHEEHDELSGAAGVEMSILAE